MKTFAQIGPDNRVVELFVAETAEQLPALPEGSIYREAHANVVIGTSYDRATEVFVGVEAPEPVVAPEPEADPSPIPEPPTVPEPRFVDPIEFKLLFTAPERVAIKASQDAVVQDFFELVDQQRETNMRDPSRGRINLQLQSVGDALDYLTATGILAEGRTAEILSGEVR